MQLVVSNCQSSKRYLSAHDFKSQMVMSSSEMSSLKDSLAAEFPRCFTKQFMDLNNLPRVSTQIIDIKIY